MLLVLNLPYLLLHLLLQLSNESLGSHKQPVLLTAQRFIDQLEQQVQNQAWQIKDQEKCAKQMRLM